MKLNKAAGKVHCKIITWNKMITRYTTEVVKNAKKETIAYQQKHEKGKTNHHLR